MRTSLTTIFVLFCHILFSQIDLNNWGTVINIQPDAILSVNGNFIINDTTGAPPITLPTTRNTGTLRIGGNLINNSNSTMFLDEGIPGPVIFDGTADQSIISPRQIYLPSIFMEKDAASNLILALDTIRVDSSIRFNPGNLGHIMVGDNKIIMETNGFIVGERENSRLVIDGGSIEIEMPTLENIADTIIYIANDGTLTGTNPGNDSIFFQTPSGFDIGNLFGIGWGTINPESAQGENGGTGVQIWRESTYAPITGQTQVANGVTAGRMYRMNFFQKDDSLSGVILHYFPEDLEDVPGPHALYVSNNNGISWKKIAESNSVSNDSTITYTIENIPIEPISTSLDPLNASNLFVVSEAECNPAFIPRTREALTSFPSVDKTGPTYVIDICDGDELTINYSNKEDEEFEWFFKDVFVSANNNILIPAVTKADSGLYSIDIVNSRGCELTRDILVRVWGPPAVSFDFTSGNICDGDEVTFTDTTPTTQGEIIRYLWDFGDGSNPSELTNPKHTYDTAGFYTVKLEVETEYGCVDSLKRVITIRPVSVADFDIKTSKIGSDISEICSGETFFFDPKQSVFLNGNQIPTLIWDFGDGNSRSFVPDGSTTLGDTATFGEVFHTYEDVLVDTDFTVTLTDTTTFGCSTSFSQVVRVYAQPDSTFDIKENGSIITESCIGTEIEFQSIQAEIDQSSYKYLWSFGDLAGTIDTLPNPAFSYSTSGEYFITLTVESRTTGCSVTSTKSLIISDTPVSPYGETVSSCGNSITLNANENGENDSASFRWLDSSLRELSTNQIYTLTSSDENPIDITLELTQGPCVITQDIQVNLNTELNIDLGPDITACETAIIGTNEFPSATYLWTPGNETTSTIEVFTSGTYSVVVTEGGCTTKDEIAVTIESTPTVNLGDDREICDGELYTLNAGAHDGYLWSDGTTNSSLVARSTGIYWVEVTNAAGCIARDSVFVEVKTDEKTNPGEGTTPCDPGCAGTVDASFRMELGLTTNTTCQFEEVQFISSASEIDPTAYYFFWDFDDGTTSDEVAPFKVFSVGDTYNVTLSVTSKIDGCDASFSDNFTIYPSPNIPINSIVSTCSNAITLDAENIGATYRWTDQISGNLLSTNQTYTASSVTDDLIFLALEVTNSFGCVSTQEIEVNLNADIDIDLGPDFLACESAVIGSNEFPTATFLWSTGETTPTIEVTETGLYSVTVTETENLCSSSDEVFITIESLPLPDLGSDLNLCFGEVAVLDPGAFAGYQWSNGSTSSTIEIGASGTYWVDVTNEFGCTNRDTISISMTTDNELDLPEELQLCSESGIEIDAGIAATRYQWGSSTGFSSNERIISVSEVGTYWLEVENECLQRDTIDIIETTDQVKPSFLIPSVVGVGDFVNIVQLTDPLPDQQVWAFGDGVFSTQENPIHQYGATGEYTITLTTNNGGCSTSTRKTITVVESRFQEDLAKERLAEILKLKMYPNPIEDEVNIEVELSAESPILVRVFTMSGLEIYRNILKEESLELPIDLSDQISGLYLINVEVGKTQKLLKVIKPK